MNEEQQYEERAFPQLSNSFFGNQLGMSKRFYAACAAMQGLLSKTYESSTELDPLIVQHSYRLADELLRQEEL